MGNHRTRPTERHRGRSVLRLSGSKSILWVSGQDLSQVFAILCPQKVYGGEGGSPIQLQQAALP